MKSHEEFRLTVFEKAELYEKKRKARNKRIVETASLCSLCIVIGISAYLGFGNRNFKAEDLVDMTIAEATPTHEDGNEIQDGNTTGAPLETTAGMTSASTLAATTEMTYDLTTTVEATFATTTTACTMTTEATYTETTEATVDYSTPADTFSFATTSPIQPTYGYYCHDGFICDKQCGDEATLYVCESLSALDDALRSALGECLSAEDQSYFIEAFNKSFFEDSVLVVIHVPDTYVWKVELENGIFTISGDKRNAYASGYDVLIAYSLSKDMFSYATLIAPND
jgi:hypothetical protein